MLIYFRTDASLQISTGHVMRCLSLAEQLRANGHDIGFICREHPGNLNAYINEKGFTVHSLIHPTDETIVPHSVSLYDAWLGVPWAVDAEQTIAQLNIVKKPIDWLVIDHYALDEKYESELRPYVRKILVIDDLANRRHDCDFLMDHNYYDNRINRYEGLVSAQCNLAVGPAYALLRKQFFTARSQTRMRDGRVRRVLVSFGGVDLTGEIMKSLQALWPLAQQGLAVDVIVGKLNPNSTAILEFCRKMPHCTAYEHVENMTEMMEKADLAVGAGGTMTWERCCLGLPSLVITTAQNQESLTEQITQTGAIRFLGKSTQVTSWMIHEHVKQMMMNPGLCMEMSAYASGLVDGLGTERISKEMSK